MKTIAFSSGLLGLGLIFGGQSLGTNAPIRVGDSEAVITETQVGMPPSNTAPDRQPVASSA